MKKVLAVVIFLVGVFVGVYFWHLVFEGNWVAAFPAVFVLFISRYTSTDLWHL